MYVYIHIHIHTHNIHISRHNIHIHVHAQKPLPLRLHMYVGTYTCMGVLHLHTERYSHLYRIFAYILSNKGARMSMCKRMRTMNMYVCVFVCACAYVRMFRHIDAHMHGDTWICVCVYVCLLVSLFVYCI